MDVSVHTIQSSRERLASIDTPRPVSVNCESSYAVKPLPHPRLVNLLMFVAPPSPARVITDKE